MPHRILDIDEVSEYLHLPLSDLRSLVKQGGIPFERVGENVRFRKIEIDTWASQRLLGLSGEKINEFHRASSAKQHDLSERHALMPELIKASFIEPDFSAKTRSSAIRGMIKLADETGLLIHAEELQASIEERERMCSTAMPGGHTHKCATNQQQHAHHNL